MIKIFKKIPFLLFLGVLCHAQMTTVTGTVVDNDGTTWANGTWSVTFVPNPSNPNISNYTINGTPLSGSVLNQSGALDGTGHFSFSVYQTAPITPVGSSWNIKVCPNAVTACGTYNFTAIGSTMSLSSALTPVIPVPRFHPVSGTYGYNDAEAILQLTVGSTYWNVTSNIQRFWTGAIWVDGGGGSGTFPCSSSGPGYITCANQITANALSAGTVIQTNVSGDAGAAIAAALATYNVVEVAASSPVATTIPTIPNAVTGVNGIPGTLIIRGAGTFIAPQILIQDSTTASVPSGRIECPDGATIMLANGSNRTLIEDTNFASLTGTSSLFGAFQAEINGCILDANSANNSAGWAVQLYGRAMRFLHGKSFNGAQGGIWTELDHPGDTFASKLDDFETKIIDWQSGFNTGPGYNIHSGDTDLVDVNGYFNSTWGIIASYNGVHVSGIDMYGNTLGGCWATTTGTFFGSDADCDTYLGGIGIWEDATAGPMNLTASAMGGLGVGIEVQQPGNVFQGISIGAANATNVLFAGGSGSFSGEFCGGAGGYLFDFTGGENGASTIITSQECDNGSLFKGAPSQSDTIFIPSNSGAGSPYTQFAPGGIFHSNGFIYSLPPLNTTLISPNFQNRWTLPQYSVFASGTGTPTLDAFWRSFCISNDYCGYYENGRYESDVYAGLDGTNDDYVILANGVPVSLTALFRFGTSTFSANGLGGFSASGKIIAPQFCIAASCITSWPSGSFAAGGDLNGSSTSQQVIGLLSHPLASLASGWLHWTGSSFAWDTPPGSFTAGGDLSGSSSSQTVIGIQGKSVATPASGYLHYNGTSIIWDTPSGTGTVTTSGSPVSPNFAKFSAPTVITAATPPDLATFLVGLSGCSTASFAYVPADGICEAISNTTGISGGTAGRVAIFGSATTITSGIALGNTGSDIPQLSGGLLNPGVIPNNAASTSGNASTATALAASGTACTGTNFAKGVDASGNAVGCAAPSGSGTVNSGTQYSPAYYPTGGGAVVSGVTPFNGIQYDLNSGPPAAATAAQVAAALGVQIHPLAFSDMSATTYVGSQTILRFKSSVAQTIPINGSTVAAGVTCTAEFGLGTTATATTTFNIDDNGTPFGTVAITSGGAFTVSITSAKSVSAGDVITFVAPSSADATAAGLYGSLCSTY